MASYQDIDTRLRTVEAKINFAMNAVKVAQASPIVGGPPHVVSLLDIYLESLRANLTLDVEPMAATEEENDRA
jgi:hypothetical protein